MEEQLIVSRGPEQPRRRAPQTLPCVEEAVVPIRITTAPISRPPLLVPAIRPQQHIRALEPFARRTSIQLLGLSIRPLGRPSRSRRIAIPSQRIAIRSQRITIPSERIAIP